MPHLPHDFRPVPNMLGPVLQPPENGRPEPEEVPTSPAAPEPRPTEPRYRTFRRHPMTNTISIYNYKPGQDKGGGK